MWPCKIRNDVIRWVYKEPAQEEFRQMRAASNRKYSRTTRESTYNTDNRERPIQAEPVPVSVPERREERQTHSHQAINEQATNADGQRSTPNTGLVNLTDNNFINGLTEPHLKKKALHSDWGLEDYLGLSITKEQQRKLLTMMDEKCGTGLLIAITARTSINDFVLFIKGYDSKKFIKNQSPVNENHAEFQVKKDQGNKLKNYGDYEYFIKAIRQKLRLCGSVEGVNFYMFINNSFCIHCLPIVKQLIERVSNLVPVQCVLNVFVGYKIIYENNSDNNNNVRKTHLDVTNSYRADFQTTRINVDVAVIEANSPAEQDFCAFVLEWIKLPNNYNSPDSGLLEICHYNELLENIIRPSDSQHILQEYAHKDTLEDMYNNKVSECLTSVINHEAFEKINERDKFFFKRLSKRFGN